MKILTFDIEEWFHILDNDATKTEAEWEGFESRIHGNMDKIHGMLGNQKATFFCLGWVARKFPEVLKEIDRRGHEIATHSDLHQLAYEQNRQTFKQDLERSIKSIEDVIGKKVRAYRAPGFSLMEQNKWVFEVLMKNGIEIDASIFPAERSHGGFAQFGHAEPCWIDIDGMRMKEFPINLSSFVGKNLIFSGGGYFRLFPYPLLDLMTKNSDYVMTYFHPRDFDAEQPMVPGLNFIRKFKSYYGLKGCLPKLDKLIKKHEFIDIRTAEASIDWEKAKVVKL
ncbi:MAG: polysaccharide deacetylase family protein [Leadbetterella sp.]|jgi:polysaccharide deacetylase family protein (PEP-CTERM system associated)|nr:polysaccharide deacetylase family protein [Leadbetterella sp.]